MMTSHYINKSQHAYSIKAEDGHKMGVYHVRVNMFVAHSTHMTPQDMIDLAKELERLAIKHGNIITNNHDWDDY